MKFVQIGDQVLNLDRITHVSQRTRTDTLAGATGRLSVRIHFANSHLDFYDDGADAVMGVIQGYLEGPPVDIRRPVP